MLSAAKHLGFGETGSEQESWILHEFTLSHELDPSRSLP